MLSKVDGWTARIDPGAQRQYPAPRSPLTIDDQRTHPYQTSHAAWHALSHAVDHLHCLQSLLQDARVIHMYAPYSLVRGAVENASAAVWMLGPASRPERIARRLRFAVSDIRNGEQAKTVVGSTGGRTLKERLNEVSEIAKRANAVVNTKEKVGYAEIVKEAAKELLPGSEAIPLTWKLCSGIAHGDFWTTLSAAEKVELPGAPPGMGSFRLTANLQILVYVTKIATDMTSRGWRLYDERTRAPY